MDQSSALELAFSTLGGWVIAWLHGLKGIPDPLVHMIVTAGGLALYWALAGSPWPIKPEMFVNMVVFVGSIKGFSAWSVEMGVGGAPKPNTV